jgi:hypothetical protein
MASYEAMAVLFVEGTGGGRVDDVVDMSGRHKTTDVKLVIVEFCCQTAFKDIVRPGINARLESLEIAPKQFQVLRCQH